MSTLQFPHPQVSDKNKKQVQQLNKLSKKLLQTPISHTKQQLIFHQQTLKSSLFSARIEGNTLTLKENNQLSINPKTKEKIEVNNVIKTLNNLDKLPNELKLIDLQIIHQQIMHNLNSQAGKFRKKGSGIFDGLGNIVYLTPEANELQSMLKTLLNNYNKNYQDINKQLLNIAWCHYYFEKIHPFIDGNGRVGRILIQHQLKKTKLFGNYIIPLDEYLERHRSSYYFYLEKNTRNINEFVTFFLDTLITSIKKLLKEINSHSNNDDLQQLLPRRKELYLITKDHPYISLDSLARRFPTIPKRTIAYDINCLVKKKLIIKHGQTRGVRYSTR